MTNQILSIAKKETADLSRNSLQEKLCGRSCPSVLRDAAQKRAKTLSGEFQHQCHSLSEPHCGVDSSAVKYAQSLPDQVHVCCHLRTVISAKNAVLTYDMLYCKAAGSYISQNKASN
jgi:hypothetical protein